MNQRPSKARRPPPARSKPAKRPAAPTARRPGGAPAAPPKGPSGWVAPVVIALATLVVVWQVRPGLIFANTTPTGVDLGGHVWGPAQLRDHLLPQLSGWSPEWFGGLATYVLYMPVPALLVVLVDVLLPYGVALKIVTILSALLLPVAAWGLARMSRMSAVAAACVPAAVLGFLFDDSWWRFGGNLRSDLTGEFSYGLALVLAVVALGVFDVVLRSGRWRGIAAVALAATLVSHPVVAIVVLIGVAALATFHAVVSGFAVVRRVVAPTAVALALSAFWFVPFLWYRGELNNLGHPRDTAWAQLFFPLPVWAELLVVTLAVVGATMGVRRRHPMTMTLIALGVVAVILVLVLPSGAFENGRALPFWHLSRWLLAGIGAAECLTWLQAHQPRVQDIGPIAGLAFVAVCIGINTGSLPGSDVVNVNTPQGAVSKTSWLFLPQIETNVDPLWIHEGFSGYERAPLWSEYHGLMQTLGRVGADHGCGRALPENDPVGVYGSPYEFALTPYWTSGCVQSLIGIPEDLSRNYPFYAIASSALSQSPTADQAGLPYQSLDMELGVRMLRDLGVRYYLAYSAPAIAAADRDPGLQAITTSGSWHIYLVKGVQLVEPLQDTPLRVHSGQGDEAPWRKLASTWFVNPARQPVSGGPDAWSQPGAGTEPVAHVTNVDVGRDSISFHVDRVGVPVEIRATYFPWWRAAGAQGPWRIAPDYMVVVPTRNDVTLRAKPRLADHAGQLVSLVGVAGLIALVAADRLRRSRRDAEDPSDAATEATEAGVSGTTART